MTRCERPKRGREAKDFVWQRWVAGLLLAVTCLFATAPLASAETRTLKLYFLHTREKAEITFKKDGRYIPSGLAKLNAFLRDWRRNEPTKMDPRLFDLVWEVYRATGARDYIHIVSAYRSPATNSMLRSRSRGVAQKSQHMLGKAMDFFIPGVKLKDLRYAGLRIQGGGVGYYPTSGSPFVHLDVGNVRHWPKMSRTELVSVFPNGKTMHVPSDGKPLPGYDQALAAYKQRGGSGIAIASAETAKRSGGFLSALFGGGADEDEENGGQSDIPRQAKPRAVAVATATPRPVPEAEVAVAAVAKPKIVDAPFPPAIEAAIEPEKPQTVEQIVAAVPLRDVPRPVFAPRPTQDVGVAIAAAAPVEPVAPPPAELVQEIAAAQVYEDLPIPMRRPKYTPPAAAAVEAVAAAIAPEPEPAAGGLAIETVLARENADSDVSGLPLPVARPKQAPVALASLDAAAPESLAAPLARPEAAAPVATPEPVAVAAATPQPAVTGNRPASPRDALRGQTGADPVALIASGVTTTPKSGKPQRADSRPEPKPVQVPVESADVARAMTGNVKLSPKPDGKAFAFNSLRDAPSEVYTAGFQPGAQAPNAQRFSGKAVTFLSVAKFRTN